MVTDRDEILLVNGENGGGVGNGHDGLLGPLPSSHFRLNFAKMGEGPIGRWGYKNNAPRVSGRLVYLVSMNLFAVHLTTTNVPSPDE